MEKDERLLPLPVAKNLPIINQDTPANYLPVYDEEFAEKRSIREYLIVVYKRLPLILALVILTTAAVAFYMYRQPSIYQATTEMIIEPRKPKVQSKEAININFGGDVNYYNTQLELLQNSDLMKDVVIRLGLHRNPNLFNKQKGFFTSVGEIFSKENKADESDSSLPVITDSANDSTSTKEVALTAEEKARVEAYAGSLISGLTVDQVPKTNLVTIKVKSTNPQLAAKVSDTIAEIFIEQDIERETQGAKKAYYDLTQSINALQDTIAAQEIELINYMRNQNLPLQDRGSELTAARLQELSSQWLAARNERQKLEANYRALVAANAKGEIFSLVGNDPGVLAARNQNRERIAKLEEYIRGIDRQIQEAEAERSELMVKYTPEYFKVKEKEEKIAKLKDIKDKTEKELTQRNQQDTQSLERDTARAVLAGAQSQLQAAQTREGQARAAYFNEVSSANVAGIAETKLTSLKREIETKRQLLDTYIQRQKEQELAISSSAPDNIKISSKAVVPNGPIGPQRNRNILIAFLLSLATGIGLAFLLDYLDDSVKSPDDIGRHLGLPTLAFIPHHNALDRATKKRLTAGKNGSSVSTALITMEDTRSPMAEAYRHLRTSLWFPSAGKPPQTLLVMSSQPTEGKTTTAINTAVTLAQAGADVVLIDCDLRRPRLHSHFGLDNTHGLTNYLSGERKTDNLLKPYPALPKLRVITSGPIPPNPAELLSSQEMKNLLQFLKGNYKHIVIDSPPAISFTDAAILSTIVDGVVMVAMAGKSSIHLMRRSKQRLSALGARIYGVVLNGIRANSVEYEYYGYGYSNSYYYTTPEEDESTPLMDEPEDEFVSVNDTEK